MTSRTSLAVALGAAGLIAAGCGASAGTSPGAGKTTRVTVTTTAPPPSSSSPVTSPSEPASASASPSQTAQAAGCTSDHLKVSIGGGAGAGMSQDHTGLQFRNIGPAPCTLAGYPGLSWVAGADGHQVGAAAHRVPDSTGDHEQTLTLAPGELVSAPLDIVDAAVYAKSQCRPVPVRGLRVYPPNETAALYIPAPSGPRGYGECSRPRDSTLTVGWVQPGAQPGDNGKG